MTADMRVHRGAATTTPRRKPARARKLAPEPVVTSRVEPVAWRVARELADGDERRLKIISAGAVLVMNHPRAR